MTKFGRNSSDLGFEDRRSDHPQFGDLTVGDYTSGMPNIRVGAMFGSFVRQLRWIIPLFIIGSLVAFYLCRDIKRTYKGEGSLLVQLGSEYVYDSVTGQNSQGLLLTPDVITLNEVAIMKNAEVIKQVTDDMVAKYGATRFAKDASAKINKAKSQSDKDIASFELYAAVDRAYWVAPQPKSSIINMAFKHEDPEIAVETAIAFINAYKDHRKTLFVAGSVDSISERRIATEKKLEQTDRKIQAFLARNGISNYESEQEGSSDLAETLRAELGTLRADLTESEAALAAVESQLRNTPAEINLFVDDRAAQRLSQAELELQNLLSRYLPGSDPVRAKQAEINEYKALQRSNSGNPVGGRRVGPNAVYQELLTRRNLLQSTADSLREKEFSLQRQVDSTIGKVAKLTQLGPTYETLLREKAALDQSLRGYKAKEQEAIINQEQVEADAENIDVISWPNLPRKGRNMAKIIPALISLGWLFTLLVAALLTVFLDPKLYSKPSAGYSRRNSDRKKRGANPSSDIAPVHTSNPQIPEPVPAYQQPQPAYASTPAPSYQTVPYVSGTAGLATQAQAYEYPSPYETQANPVPVLGTLPGSETA